jgi:putative endonuclease
MKTFSEYILTNPRKTVLYIGVTSRLCERLAEHRAGKDVFAFTGRYCVYHLIYHETYDSPLTAIAREKELKGWTRAKKEALIATQNPGWRFLEEGLRG